MAARDTTNHPVHKVLALELADAKERHATAVREFAQARRNADRTRKAYDKLAPKDPGKPESAKCAAAWATHDTTFNKMLQWGDELRKWQSRIAKLQDEAYRDRRRREFDRTHHSAQVVAENDPGRKGRNRTATRNGGTTNMAATATKNTRTDKAEYEDKVVAAVEKASNDSMAEVAAQLTKAKVPTPRGEGKWEAKMVYAAYHRTASTAKFTKTMERYKARKAADRGSAPKATSNKKTTAARSTNGGRKSGSRKTGVQVVARATQKVTRKRDLAGPAKPHPKPAPKATGKKTTARRSGRKS